MFNWFRRPLTDEELEKDHYQWQKKEDRNLKEEEQKKKKYTYKTSEIFVPEVYRDGDSVSIRIVVHAASKGETWPALQWTYSPAGLRFLIEHLQNHLDAALELEKSVNKQVEEYKQDEEEEKKDVS